jgi:hypothetical protein
MTDPSAAPPGFDFASARDLLERFMEHGDRHLFRLRDGNAFEGWVVEVGEQSVLVMDSGPLASDDTIEISLAAIDLGTLRYVENGTIVPFAAT